MIHRIHTLQHAPDYQTGFDEARGDGLLRSAIRDREDFQTACGWSPCKRDCSCPVPAAAHTYAEHSENGSTRGFYAYRLGQYHSWRQMGGARDSRLERLLSGSDARMVIPV